MIKNIFKYSSIVFIFLVSVNILYSCAFKENEEKFNYKESLHSLVALILDEKQPELELLYLCIPKNSSEAMSFFEIDYQKNEKMSQAFRTIQKLWLNECFEKNEDFLIKYFEFSKFVDGYFAEDYFINIDKIYLKLGNYMCPYVKKCDEEKVKRLKLYLSENNYCNIELNNDFN